MQHLAPLALAVTTAWLFTPGSVQAQTSLPLEAERRSLPDSLPIEADPSQPRPETQIAPLSAPSTALPSQSGYVLGPGDQVAITVFGYDEFTGSRVILPDGTISMPLIGSVAAAGDTTDALSVDLTRRLNEYLTNPVVNVSLTALRPVVVNVAGEVYRPGPVQLGSLTNVDTQVDTDSRITSSATTPTLATALAAAGGVRRTADIRQITIQRSVANGQQETITLNLWDALTQQTRIEEPVVLRDGDSIYVPKAAPDAPINPSIVATSTLAPDTVRVRVIGEVERPGQVEVSPDSTVSGAVAVAGGPTYDAQLNNVLLVRLNESGQVEEQVLDLTQMVDENQVQDGDVVLVAKRGYLYPLDTIGRAIRGLLAPLGLLELFGIFGD